MDTLLRQWRMLQLVPRYPRRISAPDVTRTLADEGFPIDLRTVQRDLQNLSAFFPLVNDSNRPLGWSWAADAGSFDLPGMDPVAALTFTMVDRFLTHLLPESSRESLSPQLRRAERILAVISDTTMQSWPNKVRTISRSQPLIPPTIRPDVLRVVTESLLRNQRFHGLYRNRSGEERERVFLPLGMIYADQLIYLVATTAEDPRQRTFALHRFLDAGETTGTYEPPHDFSLDVYLASQPLGFARNEGEPLHIMVRFDRNAAAHLRETPLSLDQTVTEEGETLLVRGTVSDTEQLRWWLLGFGDRAEVLEPLTLREEMRKILRRALENYR